LTLVTIPWRNLRRGAEQALELNRWCKEQGLVMNKDYKWYFHPSEDATVFHFNEEHASFSTLFAIKWIGNEI
jgi:hypothetical protein